MVVVEPMSIPAASPRPEVFSCMLAVMASFVLSLKIHGDAGDDARRPVFAPFFRLFRKMAA